MPPIYEGLCFCTMGNYINLITSCIIMYAFTGLRHYRAITQSVAYMWPLNQTVMYIQLGLVIHLVSSWHTGLIGGPGIQLVLSHTETSGEAKFEEFAAEIFHNVCRRSLQVAVLRKTFSRSAFQPLAIACDVLHTLYVRMRP